MKHNNVFQESVLTWTKTMIVSSSRTMHPLSPTLTIGGTGLKESDDLVILGVTFDSNMTFEKHLRSVSRAAFQRLGILRKSWLAFHDRSLLGRCFRLFVLPVLEYCSKWSLSCPFWSTVLYEVLSCPFWSTDAHLKLLDRTVSGARFLTGGVFECDIAYRRSVAVLCMMYKIRCTPLVAHRYTYAPPRWRTSQYCVTCIRHSVSL